MLLVHCGHPAPFSNKKAWWLCEKGHEWSAIINSRSQGSRCPYCTGKRVISGETDLASLNPSLAAQWHPTLNGDLMPTDVSLYSNKRVYWLCPTNPSHVWRTSINHRSYGTGCPFCNRHDLIIGVNDVATTHPSLLSELDPNQNAGKSLQQHHATSSKHFIWRCEAGHTWSASIYTRVRGSGCPIEQSRFRAEYAPLHPDKPFAPKLIAWFGSHPATCGFPF